MQVRIHRAHASDFYLRVRSRPIIEQSESVRFAPFPSPTQALQVRWIFFLILCVKEPLPSQ